MTMNLDVLFPNAPCYMIDLDIASSIQTNWEEKPMQDLIKSRRDKDGLPIGDDEPDFNNPNQAVEKLKEGLINGEQCHIKGKVHLYKVTGKALFSFNSKAFLV